ncbi:MAG: 3-hydroxyisobutyrate dehydrogenase-like beta-hydroxyacid dehydrogenase [Acidimicrobiales bacterium]|jgi:3-hydroxyisobutyrate dehydrogenase-like beta-hydroxyacid dehydrogenase
MGSSIGAALVTAGHETLWCPEGRSQQSTDRATEAGLTGVSFDELCSRADIIMSVCPPSEAATVALSVVDAGFPGGFVDGNAISSERTVQIAARFKPDQFIDGGIVGPPATVPGNTRLYLSGEGATEVAQLFDGSLVDARPIDGGIGAASHLKMCYAAWTKGSSALLLAVRAAAEAGGVTDSLLAEWDISLPGTVERSSRTAGATAPKGWRFAGEMEEIADTLDRAGLPDGFFRSAADLYQRLEPFKDQLEPAVTIDQVVSQLLGPA